MMFGRRLNKRDSLHDIESEPHRIRHLASSNGPLKSPPVSLSSLEAQHLSASRNDPHVDILHSVWDEPAVPQTLTRLSQGPAAALPARFDYRNWLTGRIASRSLTSTWLFTILVALAAGPWAIFGALLEQFTLGGHRLLLLVFIAPLTEEVMKAAIAMWVVEVKPYLFRSPMQIMLCMISSGIVFAVIENLLYLNLYITSPTPDVIAWRWSVCVFLHAGCAAISGIGLVYVWRDCMQHQRRPTMKLAMPFLTSAIVTHAAYNGFTVISSLF